MRILQLLVHAERLSELAFLLIEFALDVEQRRVLWLERESLGDKVLQPIRCRCGRYRGSTAAETKS